MISRPLPLHPLYQGLNRPARDAQSAVLVSYGDTSTALALTAADNKIK